MSADSFASMTGPNRLIVSRAASGAVASYRVMYPDGDTVPYVRANDWKPRVSEQRAIAGPYRSDEAGAWWTIALDGDSLVVRPRSGQREVMVPRDRDTFQVPSIGWLVTIRRDAAQRVVGLTVNSSRMSAMPFRRVAATL